MNVVPFRPRAAQEPLAFAIGARVDLRIGALASGVVRPRGAPEEAFSFSTLARLLRAARMTWRERGAALRLVLAVPPADPASLEADLLSEAAIEAGCTRQGLNFELHEREIVRAGKHRCPKHCARAAGASRCAAIPIARCRSEPAHARFIPNWCWMRRKRRIHSSAMDDGDRSPLGRRSAGGERRGARDHR